MKIRKAEISDAEAITKVHINTWQQAYKGIISEEVLAQKSYSPEKVEHWRNHIKKTISGGTAVYVSENEEGKVSGFAWGGISRDDNIPRHMELYAFYVRPEDQKKGHGQALFDAFKKYAAGKFYLYTLDGNASAISFYQKMGGDAKKEHLKASHFAPNAKEICYFFE